jgi:hypothetical protein
MYVLIPWVIESGIPVEESEPGQHQLFERYLRKDGGREERVQDGGFRVVRGRNTESDGNSTL